MISINIFVLAIWIFMLLIKFAALAEHIPENVQVKSREARQLAALLRATKETNAPNFVRLVVMRLVYGLASSMGVEDRLEDTFNGALVPPNADEGLGLGDFGAGGGGGDDGIGDIFDVDDIL